MPELPDVQNYLEALRDHVSGRTLEGVRVKSPFVLRTVEPPLRALEGLRVDDFARIGKRIVFVFQNELFLVIHLMISGRLRWKAPGASITSSRVLAAFDFSTGSLVFTEASKKKRASIHVVSGQDALAAFDRGGIDVLDTSEEAFSEALTDENHTLKRALTDQRILSGIGNAYSDEILFAAKLSPFKQTRSLSGEEMTRLHRAVRDTLNAWTDRLREARGGAFPDKVTAFHEAMAVHGRYRLPCPECGAPVQRIVYAENECNYCAKCQTAGKLLADRSLSRLLKSNWPKSIEELESGK